MIKSLLPVTIFFFLFSCKSDKTEKVFPITKNISESIYASGTIKSKNQYDAYALANGIIKDIYVKEGDTVKVGQVLLSISNDAQEINKENAQLAAQLADYNNNKAKVDDAELVMNVAKNKLNNDSSLLARQQNLWKQNIGTKVELEQRDLAFQNSRANYFSARTKLSDLKRQLQFNAAQAQKNLQLSTKLQSDYQLKSEFDGIVYNINKKKGEMVNPQTPLAVVGDSKSFILEMQVDENDIVKVELGQTILITMDSHKGEVFKAKVSKINPLMNERSKTFLVEAAFDEMPSKIFPNVSFEANIIKQEKNNALLIPRNFLVNNSKVIKSNGDTVVVKTGLMDYKYIEILSGITSNDELAKPAQ